MKHSDMLLILPSRNNEENFDFDFPTLVFFSEVLLLTRTFLGKLYLN